ncbi:MAG: ABC transporter substrate-binding protein [Clostridia bacterium]|nr:ABC transporter substrate-binding protein [Clostridia bacterium]
MLSAKIINSHRYKKTTRKKAEYKKEQKYKYFNSKKKNEVKYLKEKQKKAKKEKQTNRIQNAENEVNHLLELDKKVKEKNIYIPKSLKVVGILFCIVMVAFLSQIINIEESPIVKVFSSKDENIDLVKDYELKVGISNLDTTNMQESKNIILKELEKLSSPRLIQINSDYTVLYLGAKTIEKVSNKEYNVLLNDKSNITIEDIENTINSIKGMGDTSIYYKYFSNIESVEKISNKQFKIRLINDNPYFLYALDFPIRSDEGKSEYQANTITDSSVMITKKDSSSTMKSISLVNYTDSDKMVEDFRNDNIDVFFTSSNNAIQLIGKHEYNVKKYRNGETIFILGNKESKLYSMKEIRQAIVYSLNREEIVKEISNHYGEVIDLPFIYSDIQYKYDIYGAQNILSSNSWIKDSNGICIKNEDGETIRAELSLLVNSEDTTKVAIAEKIKEMCYNSGIDIHVEYLLQEDIVSRVSNKEYDMVLADILIDDYPDLTYLKDYLELNSEISNAISQVNESSIEKLPENIVNLQNVLSNEVACIGILARNINVVYQKDITGFDDIRYFKVFENIENIGKIIDKIDK